MVLPGPLPDHHSAFNVNFNVPTSSYSPGTSTGIQGDLVASPPSTSTPLSVFTFSAEDESSASSAESHFFDFARWQEDEEMDLHETKRTPSPSLFPPETEAERECGREGRHMRSPRRTSCRTKQPRPKVQLAHSTDVVECLLKSKSKSNSNELTATEPVSAQPPPPQRKIDRSLPKAIFTSEWRLTAARSGLDNPLALGMNVMPEECRWLRAMLATPMAAPGSRPTMMCWGRDGRAEGSRRGNICEGDDVGEVLDRYGGIVEGKWSIGRKDEDEDEEHYRVVGKAAKVVLGFALRYHEDEEDEDDVKKKDGADVGESRGAECLGPNAALEIEAMQDDNAPYAPDQITDEKSPLRGEAVCRKVSSGSGVRGVLSSETRKTKMKKKATKKRRRRRA